MMGERKPKCVIVDEIDGALGGSDGRSAIAALISIVQAGKVGWSLGIYYDTRTHFL